MKLETKKQLSLWAIGIIVLTLWCILIYKNPEFGNDLTHIGYGIQKVTIDGHDYLKTDNGITHSESCNNPNHIPR